MAKLQNTPQLICMSLNKIMMPVCYKEFWRMLMRWIKWVFCNCSGLTHKRSLSKSYDFQFCFQSLKLYKLNITLPHSKCTCTIFSIDGNTHYNKLNI